MPGDLAVGGQVDEALDQWNSPVVEAARPYGFRLVTGDYRIEVEGGDG